MSGATSHSPEFVAGADASWWQMLVDFGILALPVGVGGNLLASWIWDALQRGNLSQPRTVKLVILRDGQSPVEVEIPSGDQGAIRAALDAALSRADKQQ